MEIKIGDFGLACSLNNDDERKITLCGTPNYIAPEVLLNSKKGYSFEIDVWAIGVILYALLIGKPPFETEEVKTTYYKIQSADYEYPEDIFISVEAKHLIDNILTLNPKERLSLEEIKNHPFLTKCGFIPSVLPVICMEKQIPPNKLQEFEKEPHNDEESMRQYYFEERNSQDKIEIDTDVEDNKNSKEDIVYDLNKLHKLPLSQRFEDEEQDHIYDTIEHLHKDNILQPDVPMSRNDTRLCRSPAPNRDNQPEFYIKRLRERKSSSIYLKRAAYLVKWVDMSQKYGFGYKLSNGCYGVLFNDNTSLLCYNKKFIYIWNEGEIEMRTEYSEDSFLSDAKCGKNELKYKYFHQAKQYLEKEDEEIIIMPWSVSSQWIDSKYQRASNQFPKSWISSVDAVYLQRWKLDK